MNDAAGKPLHCLHVRGQGVSISQTINEIYDGDCSHRLVKRRPAGPCPDAL
jgi:hypothetical protein